MFFNETSYFYTQNWVVILRRVNAKKKKTKQLATLHENIAMGTDSWSCTCTISTNFN